MQPQVLLMDEPFGALDHNTRMEVQELILEQWQAYGMTMVFITHDLEEACYVGTRVVGLSQHWTDDDNTPGVGATVVTDVPTLGGHPKPMEIRTTTEFTTLLEHVRQSVLTADKPPRRPCGHLTQRKALWRTLLPPVNFLNLVIIPPDELAR